MIAPTSRTASMTASALPKAQSRALRNCCWIRFPTITVRAPPSRFGMTNSPADGMKTRMLPAITPGMLRGNVTRQKVSHRLAPRSWAASFRRQSNCSWGEDEVYGTVGDAEELERTVGDAIAAQDHHPSVGPQEQTGPERNHDEQDERGLVPAALEGDEVSKRVADQKAEERIQERDDERADYDLKVKRVEDFEVVSRIEPERYAAVDAALPERVGQD